MLRPRFKLRLPAAVLALTLAAGSAAQAQQLPMLLPTVQPEFTMRWTDGVVLAGGLALTALPLFLSDSVASPCPCDAGALLGIDRGVVGVVDANAARVSNATGVITIGLATLNLALSRPGGSGAARRGDLMVFAQALTLTSGLTNVIKTATGRPRPYLYVSQPTPNAAREDVSSFPSGHTSSTFAAAAAYWSILHRRGEAHKHSVEIVSLFLLAASTGALRVAAHKHFPTDVVAGAALGTAVGWVVPAVHPVR